MILKLKRQRKVIIQKLKIQAPALNQLDQVLNQMHQMKLPLLIRTQVQYQLLLVLL